MSMEQMTRQPCRMLQLGAGIFLKDAGVTPEMDAAALRNSLRRALSDQDRRLGATLPGGCFTAVPQYRAVGGGDLPQDGLLLFTGWRARLQGEITECSPETLAVVLGPVRTSARNGLTCLTPMPADETLPPVSLCWVGITTAGLAVILLPRAYSAQGLSLTFDHRGSGSSPFLFEAMSLPDHEEPPFCVMMTEDCDDEAE